MKINEPDRLPKHIAVIMDGNGRWAQKRNLPRLAGHREGVESVREVVRTCRELGVPVLTLYAFSRDNWNRPKWEVQGLMRLLSRYLKTELKELKKNGISLRVIGNLERLPEKLRADLRSAVEQTQDNREMILNVALSYSGREEILQAVVRIVRAVQEKALKPEEITEETLAGFLYTAGLPDPDLLIRTSGEYRLSDFLIYQTAYTEIYVTPTLWPDFRKRHLLAAIQEYKKRERRFGLTGEQIRHQRNAASQTAP